MGPIFVLFPGYLHNYSPYLERLFEFTFVLIAYKGGRKFKITDPDRDRDNP